MDNTYFFSAFGTFGNPNGFRQTFFLGGNQNIAREIRTFDLKTDAIKLFPQSNIYSIRKDYAAGCNLISYSVYTFAKEQNSDRGGTFIGSSLLFVNKIASEGLIINALNDFQRHLEKNNLSEGTITVNHSDHFSIQKPKDFDKIGFNVREVNEVDFSQSGNNYLVVYCETNIAQLQIFFSKAIDLLNVYDTIYFTQSHEIGEFVKQKRIFKIVDANGFKKELDLLEEERRRALQNAITGLEKEREELKDERTKLVEELNRQIAQNEKRHQENEARIKESKNGIEIINKEYNQYSGKIEEVIRYLKSDGKVEVAKKRHQENKRSFADSIRQNKNIESLSALSSPNERMYGMGNQPYAGADALAGFHSSGRNQDKEFRLDGFKVATFILSLLLIGTLVLCFMWMPEKYLTVFSQ
ncbi:hypothetical protein M9991_17555 [Chryseobacterium gallinarum]|uniref:hypothetical protein n=1 Tax=Chryseobacterium gallinarum TaxID=1324352 RepID=UPI002024E324|nr:hypothetical protein [Chryseobacterium gallinarum]MCL8538677.1 hypothetical protein [Chryseobacterium gallinarum]